jgi:hypothetical protein
LFALARHSCIQRLLADDQSPRAEDIECLCKLLGTVGQQLEQPVVKGKAGMSQTDVSMKCQLPWTVLMGCLQGL